MAACKTNFGADQIRASFLYSCRDLFHCCVFGFVFRSRLSQTQPFLLYSTHGLVWPRSQLLDNATQLRDTIRRATDGTTVSPTVRTVHITHEVSMYFVNTMHNYTIVINTREGQFWKKKVDPPFPAHRSKYPGELFLSACNQRGLPP